MSHIALYDYAARSEKELGFKKEDLITVLKQDDSGWAEGRLESTKATGWFPISFVGAAPEVSSKSAVESLKVKSKKSKRMSTRFTKRKDKTTPSVLSSSTQSVRKKKNIISYFVIDIFLFVIKDDITLFYEIT